MPVVDRNILRIGVYELLWAADVPDGVAISEAVALVQDLSTDNSPSFVNGVLARIKADKPTLSLDPEASAFRAADDEEDDDDGPDPYADDGEEPTRARSRTRIPSPGATSPASNAKPPGTLKVPGGFRYTVWARAAS